MAEITTPPEVRPSLQQQSTRLLVIGCGNPLAGDDGVGVEIIRRLREREEVTCELRALPDANVDLLEVFEEAGTMLFVDAVSSGAPPGTLHLVPLPWPSLEPRALGSVTTHGWGLAETLGLALTLGRRIPRLFLLGVEIEKLRPENRLSPAAEQAVALVVERFPRLVSLLMKPQGSILGSPRQFLAGDTSFPGS